MALSNRRFGRGVGNAGGSATARNVRPGALDAAISRSRFLRTAGIGAAGIAAAGLGLGKAAKANGSPDVSNYVVEKPDGTIWIYPVGNPERGFEHPLFSYPWGPMYITQDSYNIQMALIEFPGRKYVLKAADRTSGVFKEFHFGEYDLNPETLNFPDAYVAFQQAGGEICGESILKGKEKKTTTILGGVFHFWAKLPPETVGLIAKEGMPAEPAAERFAVKISGLILRDGLFDAVLAFGDCDLGVYDTQFLNMLGYYGISRAIFAINNGKFVARDSTFDLRPALGLTCVGIVATGDPWNPYQNDYDIEISGCRIKTHPEPFFPNEFMDWWGSFGVCVSFQGPGSGKICNNTIDSQVGVWTMQNQRPVEISKNIISASNVGIAASSAEGADSGTISGNKISLQPTQNLIDDLFRYQIYPFTTGLVGIEIGLWVSYGYFLGVSYPAGMLNNANVQANTFSGQMNQVVYMGDFYYPDFTFTCSESDPDCFAIPTWFGWIRRQANTGHGNVFKGNNISLAKLLEYTTQTGGSAPGTSYFFGDQTMNNSVAGNTGGISMVYRGNDSNLFTGPGFSGIGKGQAKSIESAARISKPSGGVKPNSWMNGKKLW